MVLMLGSPRAGCHTCSASGQNIPQRDRDVCQPGLSSSSHEATNAMGRATLLASSNLIISKHTPMHQDMGFAFNHVIYWEHSRVHAASELPASFWSCCHCAMRTLRKSQDLVGHARHRARPPLAFPSSNIAVFSTEALRLWAVTPLEEHPSLMENLGVQLPR